MKVLRPVTLRPAAIALLVSGTALATVAGEHAVADLAEPSKTAQIAAPGPAAVARAGAHASLADLVDAVGKSVVQVQVLPQQPPVSTTGTLRDRLGELYRFEVPPRQGPAPRGSLGSGFLIDASGLVVTNNHVVRNATVVTIQLSDGREMRGGVLGRDPKTDLAVVRLDKGKGLPAISWGDSDRVRVGDSVFAVGSPFGLGNTVTAGILSARGREIGAGPYDDFLQVDAAINQGNSGGPLFDATGKVIGVNTAIFSPSGGNVGIGFAIPANVARNVVRQIAEFGVVRRGRIGVALQNLTPNLARQLRTGTDTGALIAAVERGGPAAAAGLAGGDVITMFAGKPIPDSRTLARAVAGTTIGSSVPVTVVRRGRQVELRLPIASDTPPRS